MLVLSRRKDESLCIGSDVVVRVVEIRGGRVKLAIEAPPQVPIHRGEIRERIQKNQLTLNPGLPALPYNLAEPASTGA